MHPEPDWLFAGYPGYTQEGGLAPLQNGRLDLSGYIYRPVFSGVIKRQLDAPLEPYDPGPPPPTTPPETPIIYGPTKQLPYAQAYIPYAPQLKHPDGSTLLGFESWPVEPQVSYLDKGDDPDITDWQDGSVIRQPYVAETLLSVQEGNLVQPIAQGESPYPDISPWFTMYWTKNDDEATYLHTATRGELGKPKEPFPPEETLFATNKWVWVQPFEEQAAWLFLNGFAPGRASPQEPPYVYTNFACNVYEVIGQPWAPVPPPPVFIPPATQGQGVVRRYPVPREPRFGSL